MGDGVVVPLFVTWLRMSWSLSCRWNPRGRSLMGRRASCLKMAHAEMSAAEELRRHVMRFYLRHVATGMIQTLIRFPFYELIAASIISKRTSGVLKPGAKGQRRPDQNLIDAITILCQPGQIPWDHIVDETRSIDDFSGYPSLLLKASPRSSDGVDLDPWMAANGR